MSIEHLKRCYIETHENGFRRAILMLNMPPRFDMNALHNRCLIHWVLLTGRASFDQESSQNA